jgi:hypothetical protein
MIGYARRLVLAQKALITNTCIYYLIFVLIPQVYTAPVWSKSYVYLLKLKFSYNMCYIIRRETDLMRFILRVFLDYASQIMLSISSPALRFLMSFNNTSAK